MKARRLIIWFLLPLFACGCRIDPPLHLRQAVDVDVALELDLDVVALWQVDWEARWNFGWNARLLGGVEYDEPGSIRMYSYARNAAGEIASRQEYNFMGTSGIIRAIAGSYDFLFHNNDSEALLFDTTTDTYNVYAYTRVISPGLQLSSPVLTLSQKESATKAGVEMKADSDPVVLQPDGLFTLYTPDQFISDDPADYEYIDGRYVIRVGGTLTPADYIWLIQIRLVNNNGRVVGSAGGCALTGMADGVDLKSNVSGTTTVTVPADVYINRETDPDLMGARIVSFGIPGCNAYDPQSVAAAPAGEHFFVLSVAYNNGAYKNIHVDLTEQVRALPTGGVIDLELDVDDFPPESGETGDGFNALVQDWDEHTGEVTITN